MRIVSTAALLAVLLPSAVHAADCKLQLFDSVQMTSSSDGLRKFIPVSLNGVKKDFIFDTGGDFTLVSRSVADELKLPVHQGDRQMIDLTGKISRDAVAIHEFMIGHMLGKDEDYSVFDLGGEPGLVALDHLSRLDVDADFGTDKLNFFLPDHCPGQVMYWRAPAVAVVPMTMDGHHVVVPIVLDGQPEKAVIDTGAPESTIFIDEARRAFDLTMGSEDVPEKGILNGDATLKTYSHTFKTLAFGDVTVNNAKLTLIPNAVGRNMEKAQLVGDRTKSEKDLLSIQPMIVGMNVLRKLHIYMSFGERKMYITEASAPTTADPAAAH